MDTPGQESYKISWATLETCLDQKSSRIELGSESVPNRSTMWLEENLNSSFEEEYLEELNAHALMGKFYYIHDNNNINTNNTQLLMHHVSMPQRCMAHERRLNMAANDEEQKTVMIMIEVSHNAPLVSVYCFYQSACTTRQDVSEEIRADKEIT